jgi:excisionase family DNA binding protein
MSYRSRSKTKRALAQSNEPCTVSVTPEKYERKYMEQDKDEARLLSIKEACKRLGIGHWAVYQQIHRHKLKTIKIGKRRLVSNHAIEEFITGQEGYGT